MGVYTGMMIRCCLHHYWRHHALCLSLALFMYTLNLTFSPQLQPKAFSKAGFQFVAQMVVMYLLRSGRKPLCSFCKRSVQY